MLSNLQTWYKCYLRIYKDIHIIFCLCIHMCKPSEKAQRGNIEKRHEIMSGHADF